jgi:tripartite-type tricarboxylate transporter receptor subunit TctC
VTYIQKNRDKVNLANAGLGAVSLCGMLFQKAIGVDLQTIPYQGTARALTALLGGQVDVLCDQTTQTLPHIKSEKVKLYGVTTAERIPALPNTPTLREGGLKGFEVKVWHGVYAPRARRRPSSTSSTAHCARAEGPAVTARMKDLGAVIVPEDKQTPEGLRTWLASRSTNGRRSSRRPALKAD